MKKRNWARRGAEILCLILLLGSARGDAQEPDVPALNAHAAVLIDGASGRLLYGYNEHRQLPMASTTKVMTALLALEGCSLQETVTASKRASGVPGTSIYLREGEQLTMEEMLLGLMLRSGNDAAVAIAEHVSGSVEAFAEKMNERAQELGAQANFITPNGLDAGGHSISALGLALVARQAMTLPDFRRIVGTQRATIRWPGNDYDRVLTNKNRLLREYEGATGIKTGFTSKAGRCLVFSAEREGMELIGVVLNCGTWFDSACSTGASRTTRWPRRRMRARLRRALRCAAARKRASSCGPRRTWRRRCARGMPGGWCSRRTNCARRFRPGRSAAGLRSR